MLRQLVLALTVCGPVLMSGCASVVNGNLQTISVKTSDKGIDVSGATCTLTNDKGVWYVTTPGSTSVHRSYGAMTVDCVLTGKPNGTAAVASATTGVVFGNILLGGLVGVGVDMATGAAYRYPESLRIEMGRAVLIAGPQLDVGGWAPAAAAATSPPDPALAAARVPYLNDAQQGQYRRYLSRPLPRAFAISPNGHFASAYTTSPFDKSLPSDPSERVLIMCGRASGQTCELFAVDNRLVERVSPAAPASPAAVQHTRRGAYPADPALSALRVPDLNDGQQLEYQAFLTHPLPRAFAVSGDGHFSMAWSAVSPDKSLPNDPSERALATCRQQAGRECRLFVIDERLVPTTP